MPRSRLIAVLVNPGPVGSVHGAACRVALPIVFPLVSMRYLTLWLALAGVLLTAGAVRAQAGGAALTAHAAIRWGTYTEVVGPSGARRRVPTFGGAHHGLNEQVGLFSLRLEGYVTAGELQNPVYQPFAPADVSLLDAARLPAGPILSLSHGTARKLPLSYLSLRPVRRNPQSGQLEQLVAFDYVYMVDNAAALSKAGISGRGAGGNGQAAVHTYAPRSVLESGEWYKIGVPESGIYKIDKATLSKLGMKPEQLDPHRLQLYGNATGLLPQPNAAPRPDDLVQNAVQLVGDNGNSTFDDNEYLLFYARGPHVWQAKDGRFRHINNIYADTAYYFLTVGTAGRRVGPAPAVVAGSPAPTDITTFNERLVHEHDLVNLLHSGRQWLGEGFSDKGQKEFVFAGVPGLVAGAPLTITSSVASTATALPTFKLTVNGQAFGQVQSVPAVNTAQDFHEIAQTDVAFQQGNMPANPAADLRVALTFDTPGDPQASGYLDYLEVNAVRELTLSGPVLEFRTLTNVGTAARNHYVLGGGAGATVWDVTNPRQPTAIVPDASGTFLALADTLREFVAFRPDAALPTPRVFGKIANQNLHALNADGKLDLVIVTHPLFRGEAERLANHRRSHNNLRVAVVTTTEVYNEYSSGAQDVTAIRDFMRQVYNRAPAGANLSLLLFGDASFDYKSKASNDPGFEPDWWKKERVPFRNSANYDSYNQNFVPTYQSRESFAQFQYRGRNADGYASYSSEDYYGLLDESEGDWNELDFSKPELMDVGVGRLPVHLPDGVAPGSPRATEQAHRMVDKLIAYDAPAAFGKWRNRLTLVSDDGENDLFVGQGSELIANAVQATNPVYNIHKVYLDLYPQVSVGAGQRSEGANRAIDESFERGSLIINYLGHGGPKGWADEQILTNASVLALQNRNTLPFLVTGTCDFAVYDDPDKPSAGEQVLTDNEQQGGAIGLFTTTRVVDAGANAGLNQAFYNRIFVPLADGHHPTIGAVIMNAKNDYPEGGTNNRNYTLLGDPSAPLAYPEEQVVLRTINGHAAAAATDTLRALSKVKLEGEIRSTAGLAADFNGTAQVTIYDKPSVAMTLGNKYNDLHQNDRPRPVAVQESVIYDGQATVKGGQFRVEFVVPKDINYNVGPGKISLYAADPSRQTDAHGARQQPVGDAAPNAATDTTPPTIKLALNDSTFASGGMTGLSATLLASLRDNSGINTTGAGIGHEITATLDRDPSKLIVLNDAYTAEVDNFRAGRVRYLLKDLAPGPHSLRLKAWDTYNNSAEREIEFIAASTEQLALDHVLNYPNPFSNITRFNFEHNHSGEDLDVQVQIFTVTGRLVRTLRATVPGNETRQGNSLTWDGRDDYADQLARGVYVYRLSVRAGQNGQTASKFEKLVLLN